MGRVYLLRYRKQPVVGETWSALRVDKYVMPERQFKTGRRQRGEGSYEHLSSYREQLCGYAGNRGHELSRATGDDHGE